MRKIAFKYSNSTSVNTCYGFGFEGKTCYDSKLAINANTTFKTYSSRYNLFCQMTKSETLHVD